WLALAERAPSPAQLAGAIGAHRPSRELDEIGFAEHACQALVGNEPLTMERTQQLIAGVRRRALRVPCGEIVTQHLDGERDVPATLSRVEQPELLHARELGHGAFVWV